MEPWREALAGGSSHGGTTQKGITVHPHGTDRKQSLGEAEEFAPEGTSKSWYSSGVEKAKTVNDSPKAYFFFFFFPALHHQKSTCPTATSIYTGPLTPL